MATFEWDTDTRQLRGATPRHESRIETRSFDGTETTWRRDDKERFRRWVDVEDPRRIVLQFEADSVSDALRVLSDADLGPERHSARAPMQRLTAARFERPEDWWDNGQPRTGRRGAEMRDGWGSERDLDWND